MSIVPDLGPPSQSDQCLIFVMEIYKLVQINNKCVSGNRSENFR